MVVLFDERRPQVGDWIARSQGRFVVAATTAAGLVGWLRSTGVEVDEVFRLSSGGDALHAGHGGEQ